MPDDLVVHLNREGPHSIEIEPQRFVADQSFDIILRNHGAALHVHLHLDDDLSSQAVLGTVNHYVDEEAVRRIRVTVDQPVEPTEGRLKLVTGYGSETEYARIALEDVEPAERHVRVDEALGEPATPDEPAGPFAETSLPSVAIGAIALIAGLGVAVVIGGLVAGLAYGVLAVGLAAVWVFAWR
ncbi:MAG: hypothetical protein ABEH59_01685 [Halobacteriales archaeon]